MKNEIKKSSNILLEGGDCGIIFRTSGKCEIVIPNVNPDADITDIEVLVSGLGLFLRDPKFQEMIKSEFVKHIQGSLTAGEEETKEDKDEEKTI